MKLHLGLAGGIMRFFLYSSSSYARELFFGDGWAKEAGRRGHGEEPFVSAWGTLCAKPCSAKQINTIPVVFTLLFYRPREFVHPPLPNLEQNPFLQQLSWPFCLLLYHRAFLLPFGRRDLSKTRAGSILLPLTTNQPMCRSSSLFSRLHFLAMSYKCHKELVLNCL